jgi:hypothetical protein
VSGLIAHLKAEYESLPIVEWQVEKFRRLVDAAVARVPDFDAGAYSEVPADRTSANKALFSLERLLNRAEYRAGISNASQFLVADGGGEDTPDATAANAAAATEQTDDIPF